MCDRKKRDENFQMSTLLKTFDFDRTYFSGVDWNVFSCLHNGHYCRPSKHLCWHLEWQDHRRLPKRAHELQYQAERGRQRPVEPDVRLHTQSQGEDRQPDVHPAIAAARRTPSKRRQLPHVHVTGGVHRERLPEVHRYTGPGGRRGTGGGG